jgi:hypothetical protein
LSIVEAISRYESRSVHAGKADMERAAALYFAKS